VIGAGMGGLTCAALLAHYGLSVAVVEAHSKAGGCAHTWSRRHEGREFDFDVGTSLFFGFHERPSDNPIAAVIDLLGETVEAEPYAESKTALFFPEGTFRTQIGSLDFADNVQQMWGRKARLEWEALQGACRALGEGATAIHPMAVRFDGSVMLTAGLRSPVGMFQSMRAMGRLGDRKFGDVVREHVSDPNVLTFVDTLCKATSGIGTDDVVASYMVRTFNQLYSPGAKLEFPTGGGQGIVDAIVRGLRKRGGRMALGSRVERVLSEGGRATGVLLKGGRAIRATRAVVSGATVWDTLSLVEGRQGRVRAGGEWTDSEDESEAEGEGEPGRGRVSDAYARQVEEMGVHDSFMHLHAAVTARDGEDLPLHSFFFDPEAVRGASSWPTVCIPSAVDPTAAPDGYHVVHSYFAEPFSPWDAVSPRSEAYARMKADREARLWGFAEQALPGARDRSVLALTGSPLTHARFLNRHRGTYGPRNLQRYAGMPEANCPMPGLYVCGDSTWPGIGTPAAAASGMWVANTLVSVGKHWAALDELRL